MPRSEESVESAPRNDDQCPDCGYEAMDGVDAYVHVRTHHPEGLKNV